MNPKPRSQLAFILFWMSLFGLALMGFKAALDIDRSIPVFGGIAVTALGGLLGTLFGSPARGERIAGTIFAALFILLLLLTLIGFQF
jgi:hypothetical protein